MCRVLRLRDSRLDAIPPSTATLVYRSGKRPCATTMRTHRVRRCFCMYFDVQTIGDFAPIISCLRITGLHLHTSGKMPNFKRSLETPVGRYGLCGRSIHQLRDFSGPLQPLCWPCTQKLKLIAAHRRRSPVNFDGERVPVHGANVVVHLPCMICMIYARFECHTALALKYPFVSQPWSK